MWNVSMCGEGAKDVGITSGNSIRNSTGSQGEGSGSVSAFIGRAQLDHWMALSQALGGVGFFE
jgi:hypothetical protein